MVPNWPQIHTYSGIFSFVLGHTQMYLGLNPVSGHFSDTWKTSCSAKDSNEGLPHARHAF